MCQEKIYDPRRACVNQSKMDSILTLLRRMSDD